MSDAPAYQLTSRINHWVIAAAIIAMLCMGLYLEYGGLPREDRRWLMGLHKSVGVLVLAFGIWRVSWRLLVGFPEPASDMAMPAWQEKAAKVTHCALLAAIVVMPLSGLAGSIFAGRGISVFGWFVIPAQTNIPWVHALAETAHKYVGFALIFLVATHIAAAVKHHYWDRDSTLTRMTFGRARR